MSSSRPVLASLSVALLGLIFAIAFPGKSPATSDQISDAVTTCKLKRVGRAGPKDDYLAVDLSNARVPRLATLGVFRRGEDIVVLTYDGLQENCTGTKLPRDSIDQIRIKVSLNWRGTLAIDETGEEDLDPYEVAPEWTESLGGALVPGASGKGIELILLGRHLAGNVRLLGGSSDDRYRLSQERGSITIWEKLGRKDHRLLSGLDPGKINVLGGAGDDFVSGWRLKQRKGHNHYTLSMAGGKGDDTLLGHFGRSLRISGGPGNDFLHGKGGEDGDSGSGFGIYGGPGDDVIYGGPGPDDLFPEAGRDKVTGGPGADWINTGDGEVDRIDCGGQKADHLQFEIALDRYTNCLGQLENVSGG